MRQPQERLWGADDSGLSNKRPPGGLPIKKNKILWGILLSAVALLLVGVGVYSYFSDVETATANTLGANTLDLQVGAADPTVSQISVSGLAPGDAGSAANWRLTNIGNVAGDLTIATTAITNNENVRSEVEQAGGDDSEAANSGELGANLLVAFWIDNDHDGNWDEGDYYLESDGSKGLYVSGPNLPVEAYNTLNSMGSVTWTGIETSQGNGIIGDFEVEYSLPTTTDNVVQSDSCVFSITFTLAQTH